MSNPSERWSQVAALFDELVELDGVSRAGRLAVIETTDVALANDVRSLLDADDETSGLLDSNAAAAVPGMLDRNENAAPADGMAGPYRLLRTLGEGGMGVVWLGERIDGAYEQQVAIKVLKRGMDTQAILRRFLQERRILARLHHANIVRLLDGGMTTDGRPFYVMEHVDGQPITEHAIGRQLDLKARTALLAKVADAVAYAHTQLIVHRDLKPSNVLVDADGEPRVLDFGIAKLIQETGEQTMTGTGMRVLSPAYAAPEQILGEVIGTTTDVYALGLMLCELLTGQLPRNRRGLSSAQLAMDATQDNTDRVSTLASKLSDNEVGQIYGASGDKKKLSRTLSGDLDLIVATALQRDPARRYPTATALAEDLRRWLQGRPIMARADSVGYRFRKFVRRHRLGVAASLLIALALIGGLGAALWQAKLAREEATRADHERTLAQRQLQRTQQVKDFMLTLFRERDPISRAKAQARTSSELIRDGVSQIDATLTAEPELQAELLRDLGEIQISLGDREDARATLERAWQQQKQLSGEDSAETADVQSTYATALIAAGDSKSAEALLRPGLLRLRETLGPDHLKTVAAEISLIRLTSFAGNFDEAMLLQKHVIKVYTQAYGGEHLEVAGQISALGSLQLQMTRYDDALATSREALRIIEHNHGPDHVRAATAHAQMSDVLRYQSRFPESLQEIQAALRIARAQLAPRHPSLANLLVRLGDVLRRMQRFDDAETAFAEALALLAGSKTGEYAQVLQVSAALAVARGDLAQATNRYRASFETFQAALGDSLYSWLTALLLADTLVETGHLHEADKIAAEASTAINRLVKADSYDRGFADAVIGHLRYRQGRAPESVELFRHSLQVMTTTYGEDHSEVAGLRFMLARSLFALADQASLDEANSLVSSALPIFEKADPAKPRLGEVHLLRADLRLRAGDRDGARNDLKVARPLLTAVGDDQNFARKRAQALAGELGLKR